MYSRYTKTLLKRTKNMLPITLLLLTAVVCHAGRSYPLEEGSCCQEDYFNKHDFEKGSLCFRCPEGWVYPDPCGSIHCIRFEQQPEQEIPNVDVIKFTDQTVSTPHTTRSPTAANNKPLSSTSTLANSVKTSTEAKRNPLTPITPDSNEDNGAGDNGAGDNGDTHNIKGTESNVSSIPKSKYKCGVMMCWVLGLIIAAAVMLVVLILLAIVVYYYKKKKNNDSAPI